MALISMVKADGQKEFDLLAQLEARSGEVDRKVTAAVTEILDRVKTRAMRRSWTIPKNSTAWMHR